MQPLGAKTPFLIDIAVNITDCVFRGVDWNGKRIHDDDFESVLDRATASGVAQMIITGTSLAQCEKAIALCRRYPKGQLLCTVGVHPANSAEFTRQIDPDEVAGVVSDETSMVARRTFREAGRTDMTAAQEAAEDQHDEERLAHLVNLIERNRDVVVAVGEIGIDYAELQFCPREMQVKYFLKQLHAFAPLGLPFLFHSRDCGMRFVEELRGALECWPAGAVSMRGVVHSFNGSRDEQEALLQMGLYLGLNGSAFRTQEIAEQAATIPLDRVMLETDAPWCDVRSSHYGHKFVTTTFPTTKKKKPFVMGKCREGRNEPCHLVQVLEAFVGTRQSFSEQQSAPLSKEDAIQSTYDNCQSLFFNA